MTFSVDRRTVLSLAAASGAVLAPRAARADTPIYRLALVNDMSGTYSAGDGPGSLFTARMAAAGG